MAIQSMPIMDNANQPRIPSDTMSETMMVDRGYESD